jgi:hypothetical protein
LLDRETVLCLDVNVQAAASIATGRQGRWRWILLLSLVLLAASFLSLASRHPSRWQLSLDFSNWQIRGTQQIEFAKGGLEVRSKKTQYFGPIAISTEHLWTDKEAHPSIGTRMD